MFLAELQEIWSGLIKSLMPYTNSSAMGLVNVGDWARLVLAMESIARAAKEKSLFIKRSVNVGIKII
ncbi:hypothetical protein D3C87_1954500 [compost metagenome]